MFLKEVWKPRSPLWGSCFLCPLPLGRKRVPVACSPISPDLRMGRPLVDVLQASAYNSQTPRRQTESDVRCPASGYAQHWVQQKEPCAGCAGKVCVRFLVSVHQLSSCQHEVTRIFREPLPAGLSGYFAVSARNNCLTW